MRSSTLIGAAVLVAALCAAYAGDAGHGFIKDDFRWVRETRTQSAADVLALFGRTDGFYRPLVAISFAANSAASGLAPRPYALTNLALVVAIAALAWALGRRLGLAPGSALLAAGAWAFNFHGINMAVLWISGRTALVVTFFAVLAAMAAAAGRAWIAGAMCLLALLSKEEAVLLPLVIAGWAAYDAGGPPAARLAVAARRAWPCFAALAIYLALRLRTDAYWPAAAPSYYRFTFSPAILGANILQYADRAITWPAFTALVVFAASRWRVRLNARETRIVMFGAIWLALTFAPTVFVPVRSSLYAVMPSIGAALAAGAVASAAARAAPRRTAAAMAALVALTVLLLPVYRSRNERWVRLADLSSRVIAQVQDITRDQPHRPLVIVDDPGARFNLEATFGALWPDAAALFLSPATRAIIAPEGAAPPGAGIVRLRNGELVLEN